MKPLSTAATALDNAPQGAHEALYEKLGIILAQADVVVHTLGDRVDLALLQDLHSRIAQTEQAADAGDVKQFCWAKSRQKSSRFTRRM